MLSIRTLLENGGYTTYTCNRCDASYVGDETVALGHSYEATVTAPDCENGGYTTYTCHCGKTYVADETVALGHTAITLEGKAPSCTENGLTDGKQCSVCGEILLAQTEILANGHTYAVETVEPTCTAGGFTAYTCECGDAYVDFVVDANGHDWQDATTEAPKTCKVCGETEGEKLPEKNEPNTDTDNNGDVTPDPAPEKTHDDCKPESSVEELISLIVNFIRKLLGLPEKCYCGENL